MATVHRPPNQTSGTIAYPDKAKTSVVPYTSGKQLCYLGASINNRAAANNTIGTTKILHTSKWLAGQWDDSETISYIEDTVDAQDVGTGDFAVTTTTNNDGFVLQCLNKFNIISLQISQASAGSPVYEITYWNGAWTALTCIEAPAFASTGEKTIAFTIPTDWTPLIATDAPVATDGLTTGYYAIRVRATTAPSTAVLATQLWVASFLVNFKESAADNDVVNFNYDDQISGLELEGGESIGAYFYTSHADNAVDVRYYEKG
ncbi:MAG TPA: hypothetical protein ACFYEK_10930 [Candidatus Wunengus sp. YC60]|uniref:hypothetical protein n=1 Tax=Candidatus Wunengus sp. YC60 TaxID=3367697 RepID=UPI004025D72E